MPNQVFTGYVHDSLGVVVVGARADLYATSDLTTSVANDTTDANGQWTIPYATAGIFSVKITNGSVIHWLNYEDQVSVQGVHMGDDGQLNFGNANDATILWSDADADNHAMVIGLGDDNTVLHITNRDGMATDWAVSANAANAEIRIHSDTDRDTDYMRLGGHTGTIAYVDVVGGTTLELQIGGTGEVSLTSTVLAPVTSDGNALGSTSLMWADLFLASGSVINFNNGDITLTHSANTLTVAGGTFAAAAITGTTIDASTDFTIGSTVITDDSIVMTPTASDTVTLSAATNGAFSLVTVDNDAAAANIQITADGTVDIDSAGILTLDSGAAINIEPATGSAILLDGTISVDAGVVTGVTSITSSGDIDLSSSGTLLNVGAAGNDWTADTLLVVSANDNGYNQIKVRNTSDTSGSVARMNIASGGTSAGDAYMLMEIIGTINWGMGIDNSNGDQWVIGPDWQLGGNDAMRISTANPPIISFNTTQGADFDFACDTCGKTLANTFSCCGIVRWRDDVMDYRAMSLRTPDALDYMERVGVIERTFNNAGEPEIFTVQGKNFEFAMSAAFQNRQRMDAQYEELKAEIETLKGRG